MTEILNDNGTLDFQLTDIECPDCRAKVGDWCQDNKGVVRGGALLTCAPRMRAIVSLNRNRHGNRVLHTFNEWLTIGRDNGWCRWIGCADGYDLGGKTVQVLITIDPEGSIKMATRPDETCSWSPPIYLERRVW